MLADPTLVAQNERIELVKTPQEMALVSLKIDVSNPYDLENITIVYLRALDILKANKFFDNTNITNCNTFTWNLFKNSFSTLRTRFCVCCNSKSPDVKILMSKNELQQKKTMPFLKFFIFFPIIFFNKNASYSYSFGWMEVLICRILQRFLILNVNFDLFIQSNNALRIHQFKRAQKVSFL